MILKGKIYWAKLDEPQKNRFDDGVSEWSFDLCNLSDEMQETIKQAGCGKNLKDKGDDRGVFVSFKRRSTKKDGEPAKRFEVVDHHGEPWPVKVKIGNGSEGHVIASVRETFFQKRKFNTLSAIKIMVWDFIPYEGREEFEYKPKTEGEADATEKAKGW